MNNRWIRLGLSAVGCVGVGVTSWLSIKCHEKAKFAQDKKSKMYCFAPAIASGIFTVGCILGSNHLSNKEIATLTASCGYLAANRKQIMKRVRAELGEEKAKEISAEAAIKAADEAIKTKPVVEHTGYGSVRFVEDMFGREFYCSLEHVEWAEDQLNYRYTHEEHVNYNTFYELLGLSKTRAGWEHGWPEEDIYNDDAFGYSIDKPILFENQKVEDENGNVCYVICVRMTPPVIGYLEA